MDTSSFNLGGIGDFLKNNGKDLLTEAIRGGAAVKAAKYGVAYAPTQTRQEVAGDGTVFDAGTSGPVKATTNPIAEALQPIAGMYAARETNRELNKNPPYWLYGLFAMGLVGVYLVTRK